MKGILIDAAAKEVREVEIRDHRDIAREVAGPDGMFTVAEHLNESDVVFVDDNGLLKRPQHFFAIKTGLARPYAGNGLVLGTDVMGESVPPCTSVDDVRSMVVFLDRAQIPDDVVRELSTVRIFAGGKLVYEAVHGDLNEAG
jgi:hypothetical protein